MTSSLLYVNSVFSGSFYVTHPLHLVWPHSPTPFRAFCLFHLLSMLEHRPCLKLLSLTLSSPYPLLSPCVISSSSIDLTVTSTWEIPKFWSLSYWLLSQALELFFHFLASYFPSGWSANISNPVCPNGVPASIPFSHLCLPKMGIGVIFGFSRSLISNFQGIPKAVDCF